jgi:hypothetical protein
MGIISRLYKRRCLTSRQSTAEGFQEEITNHTNWLQPGDDPQPVGDLQPTDNLQPDDRDQITPEDYVKNLSGYLLDPQSVAAYNEWAKTFGVEISKEDVSCNLCDQIRITDHFIPLARANNPQCGVED